MISVSTSTPDPRPGRYFSGDCGFNHRHSLTKPLQNPWNSRDFQYCLISDNRLSSLMGEGDRIWKGWRANDQSHPLLNTDTSKIPTFGKKNESNKSGTFRIRK